MSARLEAAMSSRVQNRSGKSQFLLTQPSNREPEAPDNILEAPESFYAGKTEYIGESIVACRSLIMNMKSALSDDDLGKSFQFLKQARSIARELIYR